jgi:hypothetical protein
MKRTSHAPFLLSQRRQDELGQKKHKEGQRHHQPRLEGKFDGYGERISHSEICENGPIRIDGKERALNDLYNGLLKGKCGAHHQAQDDKHLDEHYPEIFGCDREMASVRRAFRENQRSAANSSDQSPCLQSRIRRESIRIDDLPTPISPVSSSSENSRTSRIASCSS